jgi:hypothetical protein
MLRKTGKRQPALGRGSSFIADSLFEAMSVVPEGFSVKAIEVQVGLVDPRRVIKRVGARVVH